MRERDLGDTSCMADDVLDATSLSLLQSKLEMGTHKIASQADLSSETDKHGHQRLKQVFDQDDEQLGKSTLSGQIHRDLDKLFDRMDLNSDGCLDEKELLSLPPHEVGLMGAGQIPEEVQRAAKHDFEKFASSIGMFASLASESACVDRNVIKNKVGSFESEGFLQKDNRLQFGRECYPPGSLCDQYWYCPYYYDYCFYYAVREVCLYTCSIYDENDPSGNVPSDVQEKKNTTFGQFN